MHLKSVQATNFRSVDVRHHHDLTRRSRPAREAETLDAVQCALRDRGKAFTLAMECSRTRGWWRARLLPRPFVAQAARHRSLLIGLFQEIGEIAGLHVRRPWNTAIAPLLSLGHRNRPEPIQVTVAFEDELVTLA